MRLSSENLPTATAGAEEVLIEDVLPDGLDLNTLEFVAVSVGTRYQTAGCEHDHTELRHRPAP